jgi:hypothetical protein
LFHLNPIPHVKPINFLPPALGRSRLAGLFAGLLCCLAQGALAQSISGPTEVCRNTQQTYFYNGSCPFGSWLITGGTIVSQSASLVTVQWGAGGNGLVRYRPSDRDCIEAPLGVLVISPPVEMDYTNQGGKRWRFAAVESNATCYTWVITVTGGTYSVVSQTGPEIVVQFSSSATQARICVYTCPIDCQTGDRQNNFCITRNLD